jgi:hypothetical protein
MVRVPLWYMLTPQNERVCDGYSTFKTRVTRLYSRSKKAALTSIGWDVTGVDLSCAPNMTPWTYAFQLSSEELTQILRSTGFASHLIMDGGASLFVTFGPACTEPHLDWAALGTLNLHSVAKQWQVFPKMVNWSACSGEQRPEITFVVNAGELLSLPPGVFHGVFTLSNAGGFMLGTEIGHSNVRARLAGAAKSLRYMQQEEVVSLCKEAGISTETQSGPKDEQKLKNALKRHMAKAGVTTSLLKCNTSNGYRRKRTKLTTGRKKGRH